MSEDSALVACKAPGERLRIVELSPSSDSTRWAEYARRAPGLWERVSWGSVPDSGEPADVARDLLTGGGVVPDAVEVAPDLALTALSPRDASEEALSLAAILDLMDESVRDAGLERELPLGVEPPQALANAGRVEAALGELSASPHGTARLELSSSEGAISLGLTVEGTGFAQDGFAASIRPLSATSPGRAAYADQEGRMRPSPAPLPSEADALAALRLALLSLIASIEREREERVEEERLAREEASVPLCHEAAQPPEVGSSSWHVHSDDQSAETTRRQGGIS